MASTDATDDELLARWRAGDATAGQLLFARYLGAMYRYFRWKCPAEADDLVQATFCACLQARQRFRGDAAFRTYLFTIARHELYRALRARRRAAGPERAELALLAEPGVAPARRLAHDQEQRRLVALVHQLPHGSRTLLELRYWDGLAIAQLGRRFGASVVTIRSRLYRARKRLRALVESDRRGRLH